MYKKIIVIDHDRDTVDILTYLLGDEGHEVIGSISTDILDGLARINPEIIFMDTRLPGNGNDQFCREIKLNSPTAHIKVIVLSTDPQLPELAFKALADSYIAKPFDIEQVYQLTRDKPFYPDLYF
jgi:CheY-like chemotaxis protein